MEIYWPTPGSFVEEDLVFLWNPLGNQELVVLGIFRRPAVIKNGQITNTEDNIWMWHSQMAKGAPGEVRFTDGFPVLEGKISEDAEYPVLEEGREYFWYGWQFNREGNAVACATGMIGFRPLCKTPACSERVAEEIRKNQEVDTTSTPVPGGSKAVPDYLTAVVLKDFGISQQNILYCLNDSITVKGLCYNLDGSINSCQLIPQIQLKNNPDQTIRNQTRRILENMPFELSSSELEGIAEVIISNKCVRKYGDYFGIEEVLDTAGVHSGVEFKVISANEFSFYLPSTTVPPDDTTPVITGPPTAPLVSIRLDDWEFEDRSQVIHCRTDSLELDGVCRDQAEKLNLCGGTGGTAGGDTIKPLRIWGPDAIVGLDYAGNADSKAIDEVLISRHCDWSRGDYFFIDKVTGDSGTQAGIWFRACRDGSYKFRKSPANAGSIRIRYGTPDSIYRIAMDCRETLYGTYSKTYDILSGKTTEIHQFFQQDTLLVKRERVNSSRKCWLGARLFEEGASPDYGECRTVFDARMAELESLKAAKVDLAGCYFDTSCE